MSWLTLLLGLFLGVAPWLLGYQNNSTAMWTSVILGVVMVLVAGYKLLMKDTARWEFWVAGIVGLLAVFAPFILGFSTVATAMWTTGIIGLVVFFVALYELFWRHPEQMPR
jgi:4-hydroxybenzoate polyprenyltransferase